MVSISNNTSIVCSSDDSASGSGENGEPPLPPELIEENDHPLPDRMQIVADSIDLLLKGSVSQNVIVKAYLNYMRGNTPNCRILPPNQLLARDFVRGVGITLSDLLSLHQELLATSNHVTAEVRKVVKVLFDQRQTTIY